MILLVDNYDSFTYNLYQELAEIGEAPIRVVRNDAMSVADLLALRPAAIVISPGPGEPDSAGVTLELIGAAGELPVLGICLGHQALAMVHGGRVVRAPEPVHGKTSSIRHEGRGIFREMPQPMEATRYHSLVVDRASVPEELRITAWTDDGLVMGLEHRELPRFGVQFHPESYLTRDGMRLLASYLDLAGVPVRAGWRGED
jgi:anthranilate synthase component 2